MKYFSILFFLFYLSSCADDSGGNNGSSNNGGLPELELVVEDVDLSSDIDNLDYLIDLPGAVSASSSQVNKRSFIYGLNSSDRVSNIITPPSTGVVYDVFISGDQKIYSGNFVTRSNNRQIRCMLIYEKSKKSRCLLREQQFLSSVRASITRNGAMILVSRNDTVRKELYRYSPSLGFSRITTFKIGDCHTRFNCFGGNESSLTSSGEVVDSYSSGDIFSFQLTDGEEIEIVSFRQDGDNYQMKKDIIASGSVHKVNGEPFFVAAGWLRQGWEKALEYITSDNNRKITQDGLLVDMKDALFQVYHQSDYREFGFDIPSLFYLTPRRSNLPKYYPDYLLQKIPCCFAYNNPTGKRRKVNEISWKHASGYNNYFIAYGELAGPEHYDYSSATTVDIKKALIVIDSNNNTKTTDGDLEMAKIYLYDYSNLSDYADNMIAPLSFDSVSKIENYVRGFKITGQHGLNTGDQRIIFYNPISKNIEYPSTEDRKVIKIKERL